MRTVRHLAKGEKSKRKDGFYKTGAIPKVLIRVAIVQDLVGIRAFRHS